MPITKEFLDNDNGVEMKGAGGAGVRGGAQYAGGAGGAWVRGGAQSMQGVQGVQGTYHKLRGDTT